MSAVTCADFFHLSRLRSQLVRWGLLLAQALRFVPVRATPLRAGFASERGVKWYDLRTQSGLVCSVYF